MSLFRIVLLLFLLGPMAPSALADVNVNTATQIELEALPGIGPAKASAIIQHRETSGPFASLQDLDAVPGIGPATLNNLAPLVIFEGEGSPLQSTAASSRTSAPDSAPGGMININVANLDQLIGLPGIGPSKAAAIIQFRQDHGNFESCSGLVQVRGIGPATVQNVSSRCATQ